MSALHELLAGHDPDAPALAGDRALSFGELRDEARRTASGLAELGYRRGDVLALWLPTCAEWIAALFACARLGVAVAAINPRYRSREVDHILRTSGARGIVIPPGFGDTDHAGVVESVRTSALRDVFAVALDGTAVPSGMQDLSALGGPDAPEAGGPGDVAAIFTTSGTTGSPKLPAHRQSSIARHARNAARVFELGPQDASLCALPLAGVFGFNWALAGLSAGATCVLQPVFDGGSAAALMRRHRVSHFTAADNMIRATLEAAAPGDLDTWRRGGFANFTGKPGELVGSVEAATSARLTGLYGASEIFALVSTWPWHAPSDVRARAGGYPVSPDIGVRAVDAATGRVCGYEEPGELEVRGYNVMSGYFANPEATASAVRDGWYRTGDLGHTAADGSFVYLARLDDSLRLRGFLVDPLEIEEHLNTHPDVAFAQVVGVPGEQGDVAVAFVQLVAGGSASPESLREHCRAGMASFKVPACVVVVDEFPTVAGPNGVKVQKSKLREMAAGSLGVQFRR